MQIQIIENQDTSSLNSG